MAFELNFAQLSPIHMKPSAFADPMLDDDAKDVLWATYVSFARSYLPEMPENVAARSLHHLHRSGAFQIVSNSETGDLKIEWSDLAQKSLQAMRFMKDLIKGGVRLQKGEAGSCFHKLQSALRVGDLASHQDEIEALRPFSESSAVGIFKVEHDWASAFSGANVGDPDLRLPFSLCCFEFHVSGAKICALMDESRCTWVIVDTPAGWHVLDVELFKPRTALEYLVPSADISPLKRMISEQVHAILIALDAGIARTDVVRIPEKLNRARTRRNKPPLPDYRVVRLARMLPSLPAAEGPLPDEDRRQVRLHFRRGHWRHFDNHKTWINWTLVGDPDLGFIDKHYRL